MPIISILVSMFSLDNIRKANLYVNAFTIANCICWIRKRYRMGLNNRRLGKIFRKHILVMTLVRVLLQYHVVTSASLLARCTLPLVYNSHLDTTSPCIDSSNKKENQTENSKLLHKTESLQFLLNKQWKQLENFPATNAVQYPIYSNLIQTAAGS